MTKVLQVSHPSWDDNGGAVLANQYNSPRGSQCPFWVPEKQDAAGALVNATNPCYLGTFSTVDEAKREAWNRNGKCRVCNGAADGMHDPLKNRSILEPDLP